MNVMHTAPAAAPVSTADDEPERLQVARTVGTTADRLRSFVERIERLEEDRKDPNERAEEDELLELYLSAIGEA